MYRISKQKKNGWIKEESYALVSRSVLPSYSVEAGIISQSSQFFDAVDETRKHVCTYHNYAKPLLSSLRISIEIVFACSQHRNPFAHRNCTSFSPQRDQTLGPTWRRKKEINRISWIHSDTLLAAASLPARLANLNLSFRAINWRQSWYFDTSRRSRRDYYFLPVRFFPFRFLFLFISYFFSLSFSLSLFCLFSLLFEIASRFSYER